MFILLVKITEVVLAASTERIDAYILGFFVVITP